MSRAHLGRLAAPLVLALAAACAFAPKTPNTSADAAPASSRPFALTREAAALRSRQVAHVQYVLWFGLDASHEDFQGRVVVNFEYREKGSNDLLIDFEQGTVRSIALNGAPIADPLARYDGHQLRFSAKELHPGANRIEISFSHRYSTSGNGLHRFKDPVDNRVYLYSDFEPYDAHLMFPCFDQPDLKASYELTVEAPDDWTVVSNTIERDVTTVDRRRSFAFPPSPAFSTYVFSLIAGPYASWKSDADGIPLRLLARQSLARYVDHAEWLKLTAEGLAWYQAQFGYGYPFSKYDQIIVPDFNAGAMENVGAVTFTERFIFRSKVTVEQRRKRAETILHEMAHMWFGDLVTMRWWNGLWLNESFATFMAAWAVDGATQYKGSWQSFFKGMKQWAYWEDGLVTTHPIEVAVPDTDQAFANFDGITYGKGASVLKQLAFFIGEDDFREGVQRYFQKFAFRNTTLADFMKSLGEASGENLNDWQKAWLQTSGTNTVEVDWACEIDQKGKSKVSRLVLKQRGSEQNPDALLRPHRTKVALYSRSKMGGLLEAGKETLTVSYSKAETSVEEAIGKPCPVMVFPNHEDYDFVKVQLDPKSLEVVRGSLAKVTDPFARQMFWHTLWEMVLDGKLAAPEYAAIVMSQGASEKDVQVLSRITRTLARSDADTASVVKFLAPGEPRSQLRAKIDEYLRTHMISASGGSDLQLTWYHAWTAAAVTPKSVQLARDLLEGKKNLKGFKVEQERRWELIRVLARAGEEEAVELILRELKKDPTDMGQKESIKTEAMIPDAVLKAKWLARITRTSKDPQGTKENEMKPAQLREAMGSFHLLGQEELSRSAVDSYFNELPRVAAREDEEFLSDYAQSMYPVLCDPLVVKRATEVLAARKDLPVAAVKALKISRQEDERCIRARNLAAISSK